MVLYFRLSTHDLDMLHDDLDGSFVGTKKSCVVLFVAPGQCNGCSPSRNNVKFEFYCKALLGRVYGTLLGQVYGTELYLDMTSLH